MIGVDDTPSRLVVDPQIVQTPRKEEEFFRLADTIPQRWAPHYNITIDKLKKATAILFVERDLLQKAHSETFLANNTKEGKLLRPECDKTGKSYGKAFGRVYTRELALEHEAKEKKKAEEDAKNQAAKEAKKIAAQEKKAAQQAKKEERQRVLQEQKEQKEAQEQRIKIQKEEARRQRELKRSHSQAFKREGSVFPTTSFDAMTQSSTQVQKSTKLS